jgi:cell division septum initiation protein DivIVA
MSVSRSQRALAALVAALALAGCTSQRDALIAQGLPPAYAEGYEAGCSSGDAAAGGLFGEARKDASRYAADAQYTKGWDDGFAKCQRDMAAMVRDARLRHPGGDD